MAKLPASVRTEVLATIATTEAEVAQFTADVATAQQALELATRRRARATVQLEKQQDMVKWLDAVNAPTTTT